MTEKKTTTKKTPKALAEEMFKAGVHFGHRKSSCNPKMKKYIYGVRNNVHIIDLELTIEELKKASEFIKEIIKKKGKILFIGTRPQDQVMVEEIYYL